MSVTGIECQWPTVALKAGANQSQQDVLFRGCGLTAVS